MSDPIVADEYANDYWKRFGRWLTIALVALAIAIPGIVFFAQQSQNAQLEEVARLRTQSDEQQQQIRDLSSQVGANAEQGNCRARITTWAQSLDTQAGVLFREILIDRAIAGPDPEVLRPKVQQLNDLNQQVGRASDLRAKSVALCAADPSFMPPT